MKFGKIIKKAVETAVKTSPIGMAGKSALEMSKAFSSTKRNDSGTNPYVTVAKEVMKSTVKVSPVGRAVVDVIDAKNEVDKQNKAKNELNNTIERAKRLNGIVQEDINKLGKEQTEILASFSDFADAMERFQDRPEFDTIVHKKLDMPSINIAKIATESSSAKDIIFKVAKKNLGWDNIALGGGLGVLALTSLTTILPVFSLSLVARGLFSGKNDSKEAIWAQINESQDKIDKLISRLSEIHNSILEFLNSLNRVNGYYASKMELIQDIVEKYSKRNSTQKISWNRLTEDERLTIQNCVLIVGLLFNMCKVELLKIDKTKNELLVNRKVGTKLINKAEEVISQVA